MRPVYTKSTDDPKLVWPPAPVVAKVQQKELSHIDVTRLFAIASLLFSVSSVIILWLIREATVFHIAQQTIQNKASVFAAIIFLSPCVGLLLALSGWRHRVGKIGVALALSVLAVYFLWPSFH